MSEKGDQEIDSRTNDGMLVSWMLRASGSHYVMVQDANKGTFDMLEPPSGEAAAHYYLHPQMYLGELAIPPNVILGED